MIEVYVRGRSPAEVATRLGLTDEDLRLRATAALRALKTAVAASTVERTDPPAR